MISRYDVLMRGVVVAVLAVGACRLKPPEPLAREAEIEPVGELPRPPEPVLVPRPEIDVSHLVPDPTHEPGNRGRAPCSNDRPSVEREATRGSERRRLIARRLPRPANRLPGCCVLTSLGLPR